MVLLQSKALAMGMDCPDFSLLSVDDKRYGLADFSKSQALLIAFICNHCPYVRAIEGRLIELAQKFSTKDLQVVGIASNDYQRYPSDHPSELLKRSQDLAYGFPYLVDEDQSVAKAFDAVCTPDFFLFDQARKLFYHGQLDDNWQDASKVTRHDLEEAIVRILAGQPRSAEQKPSMGCSIKWKS